MKKNKLGQTGLDISQIAFDCTYLHSVKTRDILPLLRKAWQSGICFFHLPYNSIIWNRYVRYGFERYLAQLKDSIPQQPGVIFSVQTSSAATASIKDDLAYLNSVLGNIAVFSICPGHISDPPDVVFNRLKEAKANGLAQNIGIVGDNLESLHQLVTEQENIDVLYFPHNIITHTDPHRSQLIKKARQKGIGMVASLPFVSESPLKRITRNHAKALTYALKDCNAVCVKITRSKELHDILEIYEKSQSLSIDPIEPIRPLVYPVGDSYVNYKSAVGSTPEPGFILKIYELFNEEFGLKGWFREHYERFVLGKNRSLCPGTGSTRESQILDRLEEIAASMEPPHVPVIVKTHPGQHPGKKTGKIVMVKGKDRCQMISAGLDYLNPGFRGPVVIKPNLVFPGAAPTTTGRDMIRCLIQYLRSRQVVSISTADGSPLGIHTTTMEIADYCGFLEIDGMNFISLDAQDDYAACQCPAWQQMPSAQVHRVIANSNCIINFPVLKGHGICGMTGALKNNVGCTTRKSRNILHHYHSRGDLPGFLRAVAEIAHAVNPGFTILDASLIMVGNHIAGTPQQADCIIMGSDMVAIDYQAAQLLADFNTAFDPDTIAPLLDHAEMLGLGSRSTPVKTIRL